jgi:hypothetical protein
MCAATGEWTVEQFTETFPATDFEGRPFLIPHTYKVVCGSKIICTSPFKEAAQGIADAHNAALAAEREISDGLGKLNDQLRAQLAAAQAAMKQLNGCRNRMANAFNAFGSTRHEGHAKEFWNADDDFDKAMSNDTEALAAAIAAAQKPLVDALRPFAALANEIPNNRKQLGVLTQEDFIRAAAASQRWGRSIKKYHKRPKDCA